MRLAESPLLATYVGVHTSDDQLGRTTEEDLARRERETRAFLEALAKIDRAALPAADQVSYDLFGTELRDRLDSRRFGEEQLMLNADSGFHTELAQLPDQVPLATVQDYENYLSRLRQFPRVFDESIALMRRGLARGMTPPRVAIAGVDATRRGARRRDGRKRASSTSRSPISRRPFRPASASGCAPRAAAPSRRRCCPPTGASATSCATSTCRRAGRRSPPPTCPTAGSTTAISSATSRPST